MSNICCIFNMAPHYRKAIYKLMNDTIHCDFYFGDRSKTNVKKMDYSGISGFKGELPRIYKTKDLYYLKGMLKVARMRNYDTFFISAENVNLSSYLFLLYAKLSGKKVIGWSHGWFKKKNWIYNLGNKWYFSLFDHLMLYGNYAKQFMAQHGLDESKMSVIYNSLDYEKQLEVRKSLCKSDIYRKHFKNDFPVVLYIGRIQKRKRLDVLVEALSILKEKGMPMNFVCIGAQRDDIRLDEMLKYKELEQFSWLYGPLYDEEKKGEMIYNADVCVSPGNVGLTAIDSLMYGLPVITNNDFSTQMPEFEVVIEGETGSFFERNNAIDLAAKIETWLKSNKDCNRDPVSERCYSVIDEHYNPHYQIKVIENALKQIK